MLQRTQAIIPQEGMMDFNVWTYWGANPQYRPLPAYTTLPVGEEGVISQVTLEAFAYYFHLAVKAPSTAAAHGSNHPANLNIIQRIYLADLRACYLGILTAVGLSSSGKGAPQPAKIKAITNQIFSACFQTASGPQDKAGSAKLERLLKRTLFSAKRWHAVQKRYGTGMLALIPCPGGSWVIEITEPHLRIFLDLIAIVRPDAVRIAREITPRIIAMRQDCPPPVLSLGGQERAT